MFVRQGMQEKENRETKIRGNKKKKKKEKVRLSPNESIIKLHVNGLNTSIKIGWQNRLSSRDSLKI